MPLVTVLLLIAKLFLMVALFVFCSPSMSVSYTNGIEDNVWRTQGSVFDCYLLQTIPFYGDAIFHIQAGGQSHFYFKSYTSRLKSGKASLVVLAPAWSAYPNYEDLGLVKVKQGLKPIWLGSRRAEQMMSRLNEGFEIEFKRLAWYESHKSARLALSPIGFREVYKQYLSCLGGLLPASFAQLERSSLYFPAGVLAANEDLSKANQRKLDKVLALIAHDKAIGHYYIDGHTDSEGDRVDNLELSKVRAHMVSDYLQKHGVPEALITVRWHGERYPVTSNHSSSGRAKNRRVTLRLERMDEPVAQPQAQVESKSAK